MAPNRRQVVSSEMKIKMEKFLKENYYNLTKPTSFSSAALLYKYGKKEFPSMTLKFVSDWLDRQYVDVIHKARKTPKQRQYAKYVSTAPNLSIGIMNFIKLVSVCIRFSVTDCDTAFFGANKRHPAMVCTDAFSSRIMVQPLQNVTANRINVAFNTMIKKQSTDGQYPLNVRTDAGLCIYKLLSNKQSVKYMLIFRS